MSPCVALFLFSICRIFIAEACVKVLFYRHYVRPVSDNKELIVVSIVRQA